MGTSAATLVIESLFCPAAPDLPDQPKTKTRLDAIPGWVIRCARDEARTLFRLVGQQGQTVQSIREEISISSNAAAEMFAFIEDHPEEAPRILAAIEFRNRVLREFDALTVCTKHAERIAAADADSARFAAAILVRPLLHELVVQVSA